MHEHAIHWIQQRIIDEDCSITKLHRLSALDYTAPVSFHENICFVLKEPFIPYPYNKESL